MRRFAGLLSLLLLMGASPCGGDDEPPPPTPTSIAMDYASDAFYDAPFPDEAHRAADGSVDLSAFPDPRPSQFVTRLLDVARTTPGFGITSPIYFRASAALSPASLGSGYEASTSLDAPVFLMRVDDGSGERHPVEAQYREDGGPWGAPHLLSLLPLQGRPLASGALYAAAIRDTVRDAAGDPLAIPAALVALRAGERPGGMSDDAFTAHREALVALEAAGVDTTGLVGLAVFATRDPAAGLQAARELALARPLPVVTGLALTETFDDFCVYGGTTQMPDYQRGVLPYDDGGAWDLEQPPIMADARVVITVPRAMRAGAIPTVVMSRTGGGGDRPLVDRGFRAEPGGPPVEAGSGPAREMAAVGWAGVSIDGPHGGPRNPMGMDEQFLMFNVNNPAAMVDNVRQSALELALAAHVMNELTVDATDCPGVDGPVTFEARALMGHSMGATIAPLTFEVEPLFDALILSGAGGSWIMNVVHKESPIEVRPFAEALLGINGRWALHEHDPILGVLQWAGESADPPVYATRLREGERHVLMLQGIIDTYILPPMANAMSLSYGLDLAGPALDVGEPGLDRFASLESHLSMSPGEVIALPASGNRGGATTVVVQHAEGGIEDGHEVVFQTETPKAQYRCFLQTLARGEAPTVPDAAGVCP